MNITELKKIKPECIPALPSRKLILMTYNKYRKGYHYLDDAIELRSIVLPVAKVFLYNTEQLRKLCKYEKDFRFEDGMDKARMFEKLIDRFCEKSDGLLSGQDGHWIRYLRERIVELENAKKDIDILVAIDKVFNYAHDQGPLLIHMVKGQGRHNLERLKDFLDTLDTIRDW